MKSAKAPKTPTVICDLAFQRTATQLKAIKYCGPSSLCWDDTELCADERLVFDESLDSYVIIGYTAGPVPVTNPDQAREIMKSGRYTLATKVCICIMCIVSCDSFTLKVRVYVVQPSLNRLAPTVLLRISITDKHTAEELTPYSDQIAHGLIQHGVNLVSVCCDRAATERSVLRQFLEKADGIKRFSVPSPLQGDHTLELNVDVAIIAERPIVMVQDALHGRKTMRNNLFSGSPLLALGNFLALYRLIWLVALEPGSPIYRGDAERVDHQDDNTAARLFSAALLW